MITLSATIKKLDGSYIQLNQRNSLNIERSIFDRKDLNIPSWGIVSNGGQISFVDTDRSIKLLAESRQLKSNMEIEFTLNNSISKYSEIVGKFFTEQWDYDNDNFEVVVSVTDGLEKLQEIAFQEYTYDYDNVERDVALSNIYKSLWKLTPLELNFLSYENLDVNTKNVLNTRYAQLKILEKRNLWGAWDELAKASHSHIFRRNNGETVFIYKGGN